MRGGCRKGIIYRQQGHNQEKGSPENISGGVGGGSRRGRGRKDRHSLTQRPKLSPTTAGHISGTFSSGWGSERASRGRGQPLSNVDSVGDNKTYYCS